jgi:acetoin utilization protein AcuC
MAGPVRLIWGEAFMGYQLSDEHPLQPLRAKLTVELIRELGLLEQAELVPPREATEAEIALAHTRPYVDLVSMLSDPFM